MPIETYFQQSQETLAACPLLQTSTITYEKRGTYEGFLRGEITFIDASILHLREFVDVEIEVERLVYVYQYMDSAGALVFRYDNTGHHRRRNLTTYPHHKHDRDEDNVISSSAPDLAAVLREIASIVRLP